MNEIKVNVDQFEMVSKKFESAANRCSNIQKQIESSTNALLDCWEGESKSAFEHEYGILKQDMCNYSEVLKYIEEEIRDIGNKFKEADTFLERQILNRD